MITRTRYSQSFQVQELYDTIDAILDPNEACAQKASVRKKGKVDTDAIPMMATSLKMRIRAWQVDAALLQQNPNWLVSKRVVRSGIAWGDENDPSEDEAEVNRRRNRAKTEPTDGQITRRVRPKLNSTAMQKATKDAEALEAQIGECMEYDR